MSRKIYFCLFIFLFSFNSKAAVYGSCWVSCQVHHTQSATGVTSADGKGATCSEAETSCRRQLGASENADLLRYGRCGCVYVGLTNDGITIEDIIHTDPINP